jgi:peptidyl-prolyl cis-trans isomerase SurA
MRKGTTLCIFMLLIMINSGLAFAEPTNRIVAIVNNDIITYHELEKTIKKMFPQAQEGPKEEMQKQILFQLIDHKLVDLQVKKLGIQVFADEVQKALDRIKQDQGVTGPDEFKAALNKQGLTEDEFRNKIKEQILRYKLISREIGSKIIIPPNQIQEYYQKNLSEFKRAEGIHLAHIILKTEPGASPEDLLKQKEKAQEIWERLKKGENFPDLAKTFSQDSSAALGGDLGIFKLNEIDPTLREAIAHLNSGDISPVIQSSQGFQIVKLIALQGAKEFAFDEVKDRIQENLFQREVDQRFVQWLQQLKDRSYIQILL